MKINIKSRLVHNGKGHPTLQVKLTKSIVGHPLNEKANLVEGWYSLSEFGCKDEEQPPTPPGEIGYWLCVGGQWVFVGS
jgi:hypothetical protein